MRSKRSKKWHLRKDIERARRTIEQGLPDEPPHDRSVRDRGRLVPISKYGKVTLPPQASLELGSYENIRLVRVPK